MTTFQYATVQGLKLFYREAGSKASPTIVLLHGFPSSSHMFRDLIPQLAGKFHVTVSRLLATNGWSEAPLLSRGQVLHVPLPQSRADKATPEIAEAAAGAVPLEADIPLWQAALLGWSRERSKSTSGCRKI